MLPRSKRVSTKLFDTILSSKQTIHTSYFRFVYNKNLSNISRFAFVVSKKVAKKAVDRNLLKRKLTTHFQKYRAELLKIDPINPIESDIEGIFFIKKEVLTATSKELHSVFTDLITKLRQN